MPRAGRGCCTCRAETLDEGLTHVLEGETQKHWESPHKRTLKALFISESFCFTFSDPRADRGKQRPRGVKLRGRAGGVSPGSGSWLAAPSLGGPEQLTVAREKRAAPAPATRGRAQATCLRVGRDITSSWGAYGACRGWKLSTRHAKPPLSKGSYPRASGKARRRPQAHPLPVASAP